MSLLSLYPIHLKTKPDSLGVRVVLSYCSKLSREHRREEGGGLRGEAGVRWVGGGGREGGDLLHKGRGVIEYEVSELENVDFKSV